MSSTKLKTRQTQKSERCSIPKFETIYNRSLRGLHTYIHTYKQTDRQTDRQTERQIDRHRQTDRQTEGSTNTRQVRLSHKVPSTTQYNPPAWTDCQGSGSTASRVPVLKRAALERSRRYDNGPATCRSGFETYVVAEHPSFENRSLGGVLSCVNAPKQDARVVRHAIPRSLNYMQRALTRNNISSVSPRKWCSDFRDQKKKFGLRNKARSRIPHPKAYAKPDTLDNSGDEERNRAS